MKNIDQHLSLDGYPSDSQGRSIFARVAERAGQLHWRRLHNSTYFGVATGDPSDTSLGAMAVLYILRDHPPYIPGPQQYLSPRECYVDPDAPR